MAKYKKIGIIHYRVGRTDGVSLEIEKRKFILNQLGHSVKLISGPMQNGADYIIDELEFDTDQVKCIKENCFAYFGKNDLAEKKLKEMIESLSHNIKAAFLKIHQEEKFDALLIHNIFSHGRHIAAASAFARIAEELKIPVLSTNHDYYWERIEYQQPTNTFVRDYLNTYVPPNNKYITHICINSLAKNDLWEKRKIYSVVFPDIFDFNQRRWYRDEFNSDMLQQFNISNDDLVVLQATRIVERKGIEIAVRFVAELTKQRERLFGKTLYNGKLFTNDSSIVFVLAGYAEESAKKYLLNLQKFIENSGIRAVFISDRIGSERMQSSQKRYSLWDAYAHADLVTYPSLFEGWGNQFIEAVFAEKPIVLFEYPVFKSDIVQEGYKFISFGDTWQRNSTNFAAISETVLNHAVDQALTWLTNVKTKQWLAKNWNIGKKYHNYAVLIKFLMEKLK